MMYVVVLSQDAMLVSTGVVSLLVLVSLASSAGAAFVVIGVLLTHIFLNTRELIVFELREDFRKEGWISIQLKHVAAHQVDYVQNSIPEV